MPRATKSRKYSSRVTDASQQAASPNGKLVFSEERPKLELGADIAAAIAKGGNEEELLSILSALEAQAAQGQTGNAAEKRNIVEEGDQAEEEEEVGVNTMKKKDKRAQRHERWMQRMQSVYQKKSKKKSKAARSPALFNLGDIKAGIDSIFDDVQQDTESAAVSNTAGGLPPASASSKYKEDPKSAPSKSLKAKRRNGVQEIARMQQVLQDSSFRANPLLAIKQHVQASVEQQKIRAALGH